MIRHIVSLSYVEMACVQNSYLSGHCYLHATRKVHEPHWEACKGLQVRAGRMRLTLNMCPNPQMVNALAMTQAMLHTVYRSITRTHAYQCVIFL